MFNSILLDIDNSIKSFFNQLANSLGYTGILAIAVIAELFFALLVCLRCFSCYEMRVKRALDKANAWLFKNKSLTQDNIKEFNDLIKRGPKRLVYYWQQYILFREGEPTEYLSLDNLVEKPLRTSSYDSSLKTLGVATCLWAFVSMFFSFAYQSVVWSTGATMLTIMSVFVLPIIVLAIGFLFLFFLKWIKTANLDDIYHIYHIFARFIKNAAVTLPPFIDYDLLFDQKEIEKGNPQLREFYEARARKAKEEFEKAKQSDIEYVEYDFNEAGVDGSLVLERAMRESENFINKKSSTLAKIAHVDAEKEALKKNYENVQKDLQRKIQASKENIQKLIQRQEATTNRIEVSSLRKQQEQEIAKQESLQQEYDQEETRYAVSNEELTQEIAGLRNQLEELKSEVQRAMVAEYQTFYEKIMKFAYQDASKRVAEEKETLEKDKARADQEIIIVQTQIKRLIDENETLKVRLAEFDPDMAKKLQDEQESQPLPGKYDEYGNYIYEDGSYHDPNGLFHDVDGKVYDINGVLISDNPDAVAANIVENNANSGVKVEEYVPQEEPQQVEEPQEPQTEISDLMLEEPYPVARVEEVQEPQPQEEVKEPENKEEVQEPEFNEEVQEPETEEETKEPEVKDDQKIKFVVVEEPTPEPEKEETEQKPKAKRGRPRKVVTDETPKVPRKRGRPRKDDTLKLKEIISEQEEISKPNEEEPQEVEPRQAPKPRKKSVVKKTKAASTSTKTASKSATTKPRATKKKEGDLVSLAKINKMITEKEAELSKMKAIVNNEISDVISGKEREEINDEKEEIIKAIEALRERAENLKDGQNNGEDYESVNKRLEELINEISKLNKGTED